MEGGEDQNHGPAAGMESLIRNPVYEYEVDWLADMSNDVSDLSPTGLDWCALSIPLVLSSPPRVIQLTLVGQAGRYDDAHRLRYRRWSLSIC
jgi:hypothetical protein